jgi:hypothetical protein
MMGVSRSGGVLNEAVTWIRAVTIGMELKNRNCEIGQKQKKYFGELF